MQVRHPDRSTLLDVLGNSAWLVATEILARGASLATTLYLARTLARDGVGLVESGLALFAVLQIVSNGGVDAQATPDAARHPAEVRRIAGRTLLLSWIQLGGVLGVMAVAAALGGEHRDLLAMAPPFAVAALLAPLGLRFVHVAEERTPIVGLALLASHLTYLGTCLLVVHAPEDARRAGWCWLTGIAARTAIQYASYRRRHGGVVFDVTRLGTWLRRTIALGIGSGARGLQLSIDVLALGVLAVPEEVARYAIATKLPLLLASFASFLYVALFPTLARAVAAGERARLAAIQTTTVEAVVGVALTGAIALGAVAEPLSVLLFSERYRVAAPILAILLWRVPLLAAGGAFRVVLWAHDPARDARLATATLGVTLAGLPVAAARGGTATAWWMLAVDGLALALYARGASASVPGAFPPRAAARIAAGMAIAAILAHVLPRDSLVLAVAGALGAWTAAAIVADFPHVRRLVRELGAHAVPS